VPRALNRGRRMEDMDGLTAEEIKELILEQLKDIGVHTDAIEIEVNKGPSVALKGAVESAAERYLIKKTVMDIDGIDDVSDDLVVMNEPEAESDDAEDAENGGLLNRDVDEEMTEDAYEAMEDGIPYIPPDRPLHDEMSDDTDWKKDRKKRK
jgi:hypothetical protein